MAVAYAYNDDIVLSDLAPVRTEDGWHVLPTTWSQTGSGPLIRLLDDGHFHTNIAFEHWMQAGDSDTSYLEFRVDPIERTVRAKRTQLQPSSVYAGNGVFRHYGLREVLEAHGYTSKAELLFEKTDTSDELVATIWERN